MKRSAQVALVLMGVTGTTATAAYMMPSRSQCQPAPAASTTLNPPNALAPAAANTEPCRRRSWSGMRWNSYSSSYSSYSSSDGRSSNTGSYYSRRVPTAVSTGLVASRSGTSTSSTSTSSSSSTSRGGFGSTGHAMSGGHSGT